MSLATQVLKYSSKRAVELWNLLKQTKDESDIEILTTSFLQHKSDQEVAIDAVAEDYHLMIKLFYPVNTVNLCAARHSTTKI
ncbi:MAG: hypothetical protein QNJ41_27670 [Xenococcaceae cyanobacterium MO_188.B32]|nr:hypothetical protein [Xenococcaceae cyanobacterium MO_188.B32]